jgi:SAM-dependent methyltransferase
MKMTISETNPFPIGGPAFLFEVLNQQPGGTHLDFGTHDGLILRKIAKAGIISKGFGVDLNANAIAKGNKEQLGTIELKAIEKDQPLPFPEKYFDSASIFGVIEHIKDQDGVLSRLHQVLKPGGCLVVAVPGKHLFSFLDLGNFKFVFPRLHRFIYTWRHGADSYKRRYIDCEFGLFGDIEVEKMWHEHFSPQEVSALLERNGFEVKQMDGIGFFMRVTRMLIHMTPFRSIRRWIKKLEDFDLRMFEKTELLVVAQRRP